jgi:hypothetical protein
MDEGEISGLRRRLSREARRAYEAGYQQGLEVAKKLQWVDLDALAGMDWDLDKWFELQRWDEKAKLTIPHIALLFDSLDLGKPNPRTARGRGFLDALRVIWETVTRGQRKQAESSKDKAPGRD